MTEHEVFASRLASAESLVQQMRTERSIVGVQIALGDILGALTSLGRRVDECEVIDVDVVEGDARVLGVYPGVLVMPGGEPVPISAPDPRVEAFDRICALVGASSHVDAEIAERLVLEVGNICASVKGVPNPNAGDTYAHYRKVAPDRLTRAQLRLLGIPAGGES